MIMRKADADTEAGVMPSKELVTAMTSYNEEMAKAGALRDGQGLRPSSQGARVKFSAGKAHVVDGPFTETKELVAGFTLIEVASMEEALEWVRRWPVLDGDGEVEVELRPIYEPGDLGIPTTAQEG
jgi:hypothetical protein